MKIKTLKEEIEEKLNNLYISLSKQSLKNERETRKMGKVSYKSQSDYYELFGMISGLKFVEGIIDKITEEDLK